MEKKMENTTVVCIGTLGTGEVDVGLHLQGLGCVELRGYRFSGDPYGRL